MEQAREFAPWLAILISAVALFWQVSSARGKEWKQYQEKQDTRYGQLADRMKEVETKMELFWDATKETLRGLVKQPIHLRKDELVDKFTDEEKDMPAEEILELKQILLTEQVELIKKKDPMALAYNLLLYRVNQELLRRNCLCR